MRRLYISLLAVLALSSQGCIYLPLPARVTVGKKLQPSDIDFVKVGDTTRFQIVERFGGPDKLYVTPPVSVYWWMENTGFWGFVVPIGPGLDVVGDERSRTGVLLILFGQDDYVKKVELRYAPRSGVTQDFIEKWASTE